MMTLGSHFDGIAGFPLAAIRAGIKPVWATEIEPFPIQVSKHHFPDMKHYGDIAEVSGYELPPVDIITLGSPCQDLSVAGKREGLGGERSGLFMEAIRTIREMREVTNGIYPKYAVWENVPGAFSSNKGGDFRSVLEEITETEIPMPASGKWAEAGMVRVGEREVAWRVLDAQYWGVPQRRKRIFLVADFTGQRAAEILFEQQSVSGDTTESGETGQAVAGSAGDGVEETGFINNKLFSCGGFSSYRESDVSATQRACVAKQTDVDLLVSVGFNGDQSEKTRSMGEKVEQCPTLRAGGTTHVAFGPGVVAFQPGNISRQAGAEPSTKAFPTLGATTLGDQFPHVAFAANQRDEVRNLGDKAGALQAQPGMKQQTFVIQSATMGDNKKQNGLGVTDGPCYTLDCRADHAVAYPDPANTLLAKANMSFRGDQDNLVAHAVDCRNLNETEELSGTLQCKQTGGYSLNYQNPVRVGYAVRRLTPTECERLMGFPDGWTDVEGGSDTARYKALGNSVAVPCVEWIMKRISKIIGG